MRAKGMFKRLLASAAVLAVITGGTVAATSSPASAAGTLCKTVYLDNGGYWWSLVRPKMWVPICYNGSHIG